MTEPKNYILIGQTPVPEPDLMKWAEWFETSERRVRLTRVGPYQVSTVFLGLDHNWNSGAPVLFETMIFLAGPKARRSEDYQWLDYQTRCSTWLEAEQQHERAIAAVREKWDDVENIYPEALIAPEKL